MYKNFKALKLENGTNLTIEYPVYRTETVTIPEGLSGLDLIIFLNEHVLTQTANNYYLPLDEIDFSLEETLQLLEEIYINE